MSAGISKTVFVAGIIIAILAASAVSAVVSTQWAKGPKGDKGDTGDTGPQGDQGLQGVDGSQGLQGIQGLKGDKGDQGLQGPAGLNGTNGTNGTLPSGFLPAPAYDSGWVNLTIGDTVLWHGLGTTDVLVFMFGRVQATGMIHQYAYGIDYGRPWGGGRVDIGATWRNITANEITIMRAYGDTFASSYPWDQARVMIWKIASP